MELTKTAIKELLGRNDRAVERALVVLLDRQTGDEKSAEATIHKNAVGFNAFDAVFLTSLAVQVTNGRTLTQKQIAVARKRLEKYAGQLLEIAMMKAAQKGGTVCQTRQ